jgi:hypothetical protein
MNVIRFGFNMMDSAAISSTVVLSWSTVSINKQVTAIFGAIIAYRQNFVPLGCTILLVRLSRSKCDHVVLLFLLFIITLFI